MKHLFILLLAITNIHAATNADTIILDETGVKNLRIETVEAEETDFEQTIFALGRIAEIPERHAVLSSRISGRVIGLEAQEGDTVAKDQVLVRVESRQPGNPPPVIELKSPISGLLVESHIRIGEPVEPDKELLDISDLSEMLAIARVPEDQAGKLAPGSKAHIRVSALGDQPLDGEMIRFGTSADRESGTIDAIFKVSNPDLRMRPDMRAEFSIVLGKRSNIIGVPRTALQGEASKRFVYVKHFDLPNAFVKVPVQVGEMNDRYVEIVSGLFPADEVVTKGAYSLSFAGGGGGVSLKEALDAAHGHEHAADGSELTPEKRAEMAKAAGGGHHDHGNEGGSPVWMYVSGVLFLLLLASLFTRKQSNPEPEGN
ncbi:MAG: efflux RND transporter periplasmic adaptor subunit [Verrucomicrobiota bacterium]